MKISDQDLMLRIKKEEKGAFRELFERYTPRIYKFALSYLKNKNDAEELVQIVFLKIWKKRNSIDTSQNIKAYIFTITVNSIYDFIRRKKIEYSFQNRCRQIQSNTENSTWNTVVYEEMQQNLSNCINKLPKQQQKIFHLSKMEGFTNDEIAIQMGLSKRTVENHLYRAVSFLKQNFKNEILATLLFILTFL